MVHEKCKKKGKGGRLVAGEADRHKGEILFFDLETQRLFQDVGGPGHVAELGLAVGVVYSSLSGRFESYYEKQATQLVRRLREASLVVGFNVVRFDYRVLEPYAESEGGLAGVPTLDMLLELERVLGHRISLDALAKATLGSAKTADGLQAVAWFRESRLDLVEEYCRADVEITRRVFEFGRDNGYLEFEDRFGRRRRVGVPWARDVLLGTKRGEAGRR